MQECLNSGIAQKSKLLVKIEANIRSDNWRTFAVNIFEVLHRKHPLGLDYERTAEFATRITEELYKNGIEPEYDEINQMKKPPASGSFLFKQKFAEACNGHIGDAIKSNRIVGNAWQSIGSDDRQNWSLAREELVEYYESYLNDEGGKYLFLLGLIILKLFRTCTS